MECKTKKEFVANTGRELTKEECKYYWDNLGKQDDRRIRNEWTYDMGSIGHATLYLVNGKTCTKRRLTEANRPKWRPLALLTGHTMGWDGRTLTYSEFFQDWGTLLSKLSDTGDETVYLMRHPHQ